MNTKIDQEFYDHSSYYDRKLSTFANRKSKFQQYRIRKVLEIYTPKRTEKVLDLGCGWGTFSFTLAPRTKQVVGLDFSRKSIAICKKLLKQTGYKNVRFVCGDAQKTGLQSATFDVVIAADLFEHLYPDQTERVLKECHRLLKKGGKLVIWTPHRGHVLEILKNHDILLARDVSHVDYKSMGRLLTRLKRHGFRILKYYYAESHVPILSIIEKALLGVIPLLRRRIAILASV